MRIAIVGSAASVHVRQWTTALTGRGHDVLLATVHPTDEALPPGVRVAVLSPTGGRGYALAAPSLARHLSAFEPDVVQSHYATGYGLLGRLATVRRRWPFVISVWGQDVYEFPDASRTHRAFLRSNLRRADAVTSTSVVMRRRTESVLGRRARRIDVVPFGVDPDRFHPRTGEREPGPVRVGTVKWLEEKYGIDVLLRAAADAVERGTDLRVTIAGDGSQRAELELLARDLRIDDRVDFLGRIAHADVPACLRSLDAFLALSVTPSESFGVAAVEAGACGVPSIVADIGGLPEVIEDGVTGFVVPVRDHRAAADRIMRLAAEPTLGRAMGEAARQLVQERYSWDRCVDDLLEVFHRVVPAPNRTEGVDVTGSSQDPGAYWEQRLTKEFNLHGVGHQGLGSAYNGWLYRVRRSAFARLLRRLPVDVRNEAVLDVGSGTGFYLDQWQRAGARSIVGADITDVAVRNLAAQFPRARIVKADIGDEGPPLPGESFGVVTAFDVLFHIVDDERFRRAFANLAAQVRPGGFLVISEHLIHRATIRSEYETIRPLADVLDAATSAGLREVERFPVFVLMNSPIDSSTKARHLAWKLLTGPARVHNALGWANGAVLYPLEWVLSRIRRESASTEMLVFRKPES